MTTALRSSSVSETARADLRTPTISLAARLGLVGAAPFAAAFVASRSRRISRVAISLPCPIRHVTGVPCPSCGATRAFVLLARRDPSWRDYNTVCVGYAAASLAASAALQILPRPMKYAITEKVQAFGDVLRQNPRLALAFAAFVALPPWLLALRRPAIHKATG